MTVDICGDDRFELIEEAKRRLIEGTNIEDRPEEMAVIDNMLFRFWQMGWLDQLRETAGAGTCHTVYLVEVSDDLIESWHPIGVYLHRESAEDCTKALRREEDGIRQFARVVVLGMEGAGTCIYVPDETGFTWWDENDVEHYEEYSASDECCSASCDKCGHTMMVGDEGWFDGWDEITEWWEEDGSYHKGYILKPRFKHCPNCGLRLVSE